MAGAAFADCLFAPLFLAAHRAFIKTESLALAAADIGLRVDVALLAAAGAVVFLSALIFAQRALLAARSLALVASDMPEPGLVFCWDPFEPKTDESSD